MRRGLLGILLLAACGGESAPPDGSVDAPAVIDAAAPDAVTEFTGTITGRVVSAGEPVAGATVKFGGRPEEATSAADGTFSLTVGNPPVRLDQIALTAGKQGFHSRGLAVTDPSAPHELEIDAITIVDNPDYLYKSPDALEAAPYCQHCHRDLYDGWVTSGHRRSASDPQLHDLYNGTALGFTSDSECVARGGEWKTGKAYGVDGTADKCYVGGGAVLADVNPGVCGGAGQPTCDDPGEAPPPDPSVCADCHAPASDSHVPGGTNLNQVSGLGFENGVHCDFCHKIQSVIVNERPGVNGAINLLRPGPPDPIFADPDIFFGPYTDVIIFFMNGSPQPQFRTSEFCSACHQWSEPGFRPEDKPLIDLVKWPDGLPIQDTYHEWTGSQQAASGVQCQQCHEPGAPWASSTKDSPIGYDVWGTHGWPRAYGEVRDHSFLPRLPPLEPPTVEAPGDWPRDSLRNPLDVVIEPVRAGGALTVTVRLTNSGAGHSIPSGTPSRSMILLVEAEALGAPLPAAGGYSVPAWVGAHASGVIGDATLAGDVLTLPAGETWPPDVAPGTVIRFARPSGAFDDYPATRWFGDPARTAVEKGMEITEPIATATVVSVAGQSVTLDAPVIVPDGTHFHAGDPTPAGALAPDDQLAVTPLAGAPGYAFGKVMRDRNGVDGVVFFRATDIASDNRIPAGATATTDHVFDESGAAGAPITITITLLYRRHPWPTAHARGWSAIDEVRLQQVVVVP